MNAPLRLLGLAILAAGLAACGHETTDQRLVGKWILSTDALDRIPDAAQREQMAEKIAEGHTVALEFRADGSAISIEGQPGRKGNENTARWKVGSEDGSRFVLEVTLENGKVEKVDGRWDGDLLILVADGRTLPLRKQ